MNSVYCIIRGALGVGKTTIAKKLAERLSAEYFSIDEIMHENDLDHGPEDGYVPIENYIKANELVLPKMKSLLEQGKSIIIDGCFYHRQQIENFKENLGGNRYIFTLKAPLDVCIKRDSQRENSYGKDAAEAVFNKVNKFDEGIVIETEGLSVEETTKKLETWLYLK